MPGLCHGDTSFFFLSRNTPDDFSLFRAFFVSFGFPLSIGASLLGGPHPLPGLVLYDGLGLATLGFIYSRYLSLHFSLDLCWASLLAGNAGHGKEKGDGKGWPPPALCVCYT